MMRSFMAAAINLVRNDSGQGLVEYGLILMLVSCAAILALQNLGGQTNNNLYNKINNAMNGAL